jgi:hypothetical protein
MKIGVPEWFEPTVSLAAWPMVLRSDQCPAGPDDQTVTMLALEGAPSDFQ